MSSPLGNHAHSDTLDAGFDLTDAGRDDFADGPTELPEPYAPPPDAEFLTGTVPAIDPADLGEGLQPDIEPSDSVQETTRLSREAVRTLVAARIRAQTVEGAIQVRPPLLPPPPAVTLAPAPPRAITADPAPPRAITADPAPPHPLPAAPGMRVVIAYRWQLHHVALAFAAGLLVGAVAMALGMR